MALIVGGLDWLQAIRKLIQASWACAKPDGLRCIDRERTQSEICKVDVRRECVAVIRARASAARPMKLEVSMFVNGTTNHRQMAVAG
jgi:hypothetical protein